MTFQYLVCPEVAISERIHLWEGKTAFNQPCKSSNSSPDHFGQEPWILVALWGSADIMFAGTYLEPVWPAVGCPGLNSRRPGLVWCRSSNGERRSWLFALGCTTVQGCWMLPRSPSSHGQGMLCCNPSWRVGSWSHQRTDWGVETSGRSLVWVASVEVCRRWRSCILWRLRTTTQSLIVPGTDRPVTIPIAPGQTWQGRDSCSGLT